MGEAEVEAAGIGNRTPRPGSLRTRKSVHTRLQALYILNSLYVQDIFFNFSQIFPRFCSGCFDTSGSMIPLLVPEISPWRLFVTEDGRGIGYSRSWIGNQQN